MWKALLQFFLPQRCVTCTTYGFEWCTPCQGRVEAFIGEVDSDTWIATRYHGVMKDAIHIWKYAYAEFLTPYFADLMFSSVEEDLLLLPGPLLVPVPMERRKQCLRGYNQAELLAFELSRRTRIPVCRALQKTRPTPSQAGLSRADRLHNLRDAFQMRESATSAASYAQTILLIDDVYTTGATIDRCSAVLRTHFPRARIIAWILASKSNIPSEVQSSTRSAIRDYS